MIKLLQILLVLTPLTGFAAAYPGDEVKISRKALLCRAVPYLAEAEQLQRRGDQSGVQRFVSMSRCMQARSTLKATVIEYGHEEGRPDFVKVKARGREYWVSYSELKT
tara:strand:+ start:653 stop:976 length:324 start_codon:yes stop_codon:yes gene_type:complete